MGGCLKLMWYIKRSILGFHFMEALFNSFQPRKAAKTVLTPHREEKNREEALSSFPPFLYIPYGSYPFHSALLMPPLNEPTNLENDKQYQPPHISKPYFSSTSGVLYTNCSRQTPCEASFAEAN